MIAALPQAGKKKPATVGGFRLKAAIDYLILPSL
jgi:hypothetical protein